MPATSQTFNRGLVSCEISIKFNILCFQAYLFAPEDGPNSNDVDYRLRVYHIPIDCEAFKKVYIALHALFDHHCDLLDWISKKDHPKAGERMWISYEELLEKSQNPELFFMQDEWRKRMPAAVIDYIRP